MCIEARAAGGALTQSQWTRDGQMQRKDVGRRGIASEYSVMACVCAIEVFGAISKVLAKA